MASIQASWEIPGCSFASVSNAHLAALNQNTLIEQSYLDNQKLFYNNEQ